MHNLGLFLILQATFFLLFGSFLFVLRIYGIANESTETDLFFLLKLVAYFFLQQLDLLLLCSLRLFLFPRRLQRFAFKDGTMSETIIKSNLDKKKQPGFVFLLPPSSRFWQSSRHRFFCIVCLHLGRILFYLHVLPAMQVFFNTYCERYRRKQ